MLARVKESSSRYQVDDLNRSLALRSYMDRCTLDRVLNLAQYLGLAERLDLKGGDPAADQLRE